MKTGVLNKRKKRQRNNKWWKNMKVNDWSIKSGNEAKLLKYNRGWVSGRLENTRIKWRKWHRKPRETRQEVRKKKHIKRPIKHKPRQVFLDLNVKKNTKITLKAMKSFLFLNSQCCEATAAFVCVDLFYLKLLAAHYSSVTSNLKHIYLRFYSFEIQKQLD